MAPANGYSVPREALKVLQDGVLANPKIKKDLPADLAELSRHIRFEGSDKPSIPINWRLAESISALKGLEALMLNRLVTRKYDVEPADVVINTDHASLFFMSVVVARWVKDGRLIPIDPTSKDILALIGDADKHQSRSTPLRTLITNIYQTKDGRFYHTHGNINPAPALTALGLDPDADVQTREEAVDRIQKAVAEFDSGSLDHLMNEEYRQSGTVAWTTNEYLETEHGKANSHVGLYETIKDPLSSQPAAWWPNSGGGPEPGPTRPLAGLKVVDLTRVIAGPAITRSLAELGASVMRVTSDQVTDLSAVHHDLNWGKWNCHLHLKDEAGRQRLRELIAEADVVVDGYRPGVMDRLGFGRKEILDLVKNRQRGIIHVRENCYGWHGPWAHRSGWQQISDACCGVSREFSKAMGLDEAVTPVFPNSDYGTGVAGCASVLDALTRRAEQGGSYGIDIALNYYSQWLVQSCGTYPNDIWNELWTRHGSPVFRHYHDMIHLLPSMMKLLYQNDQDTLFKPDFFEPRHSRILDTTFVVAKPTLQFPKGEITLKYNVGTRGNGTDQPRWPNDLSVEVVTESN